MLFTSIDFAVFLPVVFVLYWFVTNKHLGLQNSLIVIASLVFYGWWDWRFLSLLLISAFVDYSVGLLLRNQSNPFRRKLLLAASLTTNLGLLLYFKYYNFFIDSFVSGFTLLGQNIRPDSLDVILPVGISFYTFQTLSYALDVYRRKMEPTNDPIAFLAFVSFFPQLVAGPIERATNLLPQFKQKRTFSYAHAVDGTRQILWGLFKKMVIADNCAGYVDTIFGNVSTSSGSTLLLGAILFSFQIYCDFSGYSDIAIGTARLFGIQLMRNFSFPYFSRDIAEFWRRWHISLTTWFRDYVYIPLGGNRGSLSQKIRNTFIVFVLSGLWHGANWTFVVWGALNAIYFLPLVISGKNRNHLDTVAEGRIFPTLKEFIQIAFTFSLTTLAWIFFRSDNLQQAFSYITIIFSSSLFTAPAILPVSLLLIILVFLIVEWIGRNDEYAIEKLLIEKPAVIRWAVYYGVIIAIFIWNAGKEQPFIYFQF